MSPGGTETWLLNVLSHIDRSRFHIDFLVHKMEQCEYDDAVRACGSQIIPCPGISRPWVYERNLSRILEQCGPYDIVHSHVHHFSGIVLKTARRAGVRVRIAHSHSDTKHTNKQASICRRLYLNISARWIQQNATLKLAASHLAASALFGDTWETDQNTLILYCGVDLAPFRLPVDRNDARKQLGIPEKALVLGNVGRLVNVKNHLLILRAAAKLVERGLDVRVLLVGDGPLRLDIERETHELGLGGRVVMTGFRSDVARIMRGVMDVFVFPSHNEGLGLALIEAQAAGLSCMISDAIPEEADLVKPMIRRLAVSAPVEDWADEIERFHKRHAKTDQAEMLRVVEQSPFNIRASARELQELYAIATM